MVANVQGPALLFSTQPPQSSGQVALTIRPAE